MMWLGDSNRGNFAVFVLHSHTCLYMNNIMIHYAVGRGVFNTSIIHLYKLLKLQHKTPF
jgi:hypothetical protein